MKNKSGKALALLLTAVFAVPCTACNRETRGVNELLITRWASIYEEDAFRAWGEEFTAANPDITLTWKFNSYAEYFQKIPYDLIDDAAGDVIFLSTWGWNAYKKSDIFEDLGAVPSLAEAVDGLTEDAKTKFIKEGGTERLGVAVGTTARRPTVNIPDFTAAGEPQYTQEEMAEMIARPTCFTAKELTELLSAVADKQGKKYATKFDVTDVVFLLAASAGAPIIDNETNTVRVHTPEGRAAIKDAVKFMQSGRQVSFTNSTNGGVGGSFDSSMLTSGANTVLTSYTGPWGFATLTNAGKEIATLPSIKAENGADTMLVTYNNLCVPVASPRKEAAHRFIAWALSYEGQMSFAKFSDLPTNERAYDEVTGGENADFPASRFGAFNVGKNNMYYMPALTEEFSSAFSTAMSNLFNTNYKTGTGYDDVDNVRLDAAVAAFTAALKNAENKL